MRARQSHSLQNQYSVKIQNLKTPLNFPIQGSDLCEQQPAPAVNDSLKDVAAKSVSLTNVWRRLPFPTTGGSFRNVSENAPALLGQDGLHIAQAQSHQPWSAPAFTCVGEPPLEENGGKKKDNSHKVSLLSFIKSHQCQPVFVAGLAPLPDRRQKNNK